MTMKKMFSACASVAIALALAGCGVLATNGLDYSSYPIPKLPAPPPPPPVVAAPPPPCQAPTPGQPASLAGCKTGDRLVLRGVNFEFDQARLTVNARSLLDQVAVALAARPDIKVEIGGHTDGKGSDSYNLPLSQKRAQTVLSYLVSQGVPTMRMTAQGYGKGVSIADNGTDEGRELNRRVELKVIESAPPPVSMGPTAETTSLAAAAEAKNSAIVVLEPLPAHAAEPGAGIPTSIGVLTHVPHPQEAGPVPDYKNRTDVAPPPPKAGPAWVNRTGGNTYDNPAEPSRPPAATSAPARVSLSNYSFMPASLTVAHGVTVTWSNQDPATHTVKFAEREYRLASGESFSRSFDKPGVYTYQCGIHPSMQGKVIVN